MDQIGLGYGIGSVNHAASGPYSVVVDVARHVVHANNKKKSQPEGAAGDQVKQPWTNRGHAPQKYL